MSIAKRFARSTAARAALLLFAAAGLAASALLAQQQAPLPRLQQPQESSAPQGAAQAAQQTPTYSTDVNVVSVLATVRTKKNEVVRNLTKDDFILEQDGHPQTIRYFAQESNLPLTIGLLVDTSLSQRAVLEQERRASYSFLDDVLRSNDLAFVLHFEGEVELLQDLTSDRKKLESALDLLQTPQLSSRNGPYGGGGGGGGGRRSPWPGGGGGGGNGGGGNGRVAGGTALYDAVYLASDEVMKKQAGRKALIILSDGVDNSSKVTLTTAIESAQRADVLVYSILFSDTQAYGGIQGGFGGLGGGRRGGFPQRFPPRDGKDILTRISKETGARMFEVSKGQSIDQIYALLEDELRNQYSIGFTPEGADRSPGYHKLHLTVRPKDLVVQTRDGYYATN